MVVVTVKYDCETHVNQPLEETYNEVCRLVTTAEENFILRLADNKLMILKPEAIKRAVFLVEEVSE